MAVDKQAKFSGKQLVDEFLGRNMAPHHAKLQDISASIAEANKKQGDVLKKYTDMRNKANANFPAHALAPKTWKNFPEQIRASAKARLYRSGETAKIKDTLKDLAAKQEVARQALHGEAAKSLRTRAIGLALPAAAAAGGVYLKKQYDEKKARDSARQAYFESMSQPAAQ